jgi:hypothetical protein
MANYYTNFSLVLKLSEKQKRYALDLANKGSNYSTDDQVPDGFPVSLVDALDEWFFEIEDEKEGLWIHSENGGIDAACLFIQHLLQKYDLQGHIAFEWSHDCSKPRVDAFGGGAAIVTATEIKTLNTSDWINLNVPHRQHLFSPTTHLCHHCGIHADDDLVENQPCALNKT